MNRQNYSFVHYLKKLIESNSHHISIRHQKDVTKDIKFNADKERKVLSFTGKVDTFEIPAKDFETGLDIPDWYVTRYLFECYDITTKVNSQDNDNGLPAIW